MNRLYYAGIGANDTPKPILELMTKLSSKLEEEGLILRASYRNKADKSFIKGVSEPEHREIFIINYEYNTYSQTEEPTPYLNNYKIYFTEEGMQSIYEYMIEPSKLTVEDKAYLILSYYQIYGYQHINREILHCNPVDFVICWTEDGCNSHTTRTNKTGITGQAISIADTSYIYIPIYNLQNEKHKHILNNYLSGSITVKDLIIGEDIKPYRWKKLKEYSKELKKLTEEKLNQNKPIQNNLDDWNNGEDALPF